MITSTREEVRKKVERAKQDPVSAYIQNGKTIQGFRKGENVMLCFIDYVPNMGKAKGEFILAPHDLPPEAFNPIEKE
jgi:hypothetical protein